MIDLLHLPQTSTCKDRAGLEVKVVSGSVNVLSLDMAKHRKGLRTTDSYQDRFAQNQSRLLLLRSALKKV